MKFKLYREFGALNSTPVFNAFESGLKKLGHQVVTSNEDIAVIWSVLWRGRQHQNKDVYDQCVALGKPILILEVGSLIRGITWKVSLSHINGNGYFGNNLNIDMDRPSKLGISLHTQVNPKPEILIAGQHESSLQWENQPPMQHWVEQTINLLAQYTSRKIIVRPHPRSPFNINYNLQIPQKLQNTYDSYDIDYNYHCVINFNSGPAVQAAIAGTRVVCDKSSLAYPVSSLIENIEVDHIVDRTQWFIELAHTEWTLSEIENGIPLSRLHF